MLPERLGTAQLADLAAQGARRTWRLRAGEMPRLARSLAKDGAADELLLEAEFRQGPEGFPEVRLRITGTIGLVCQRCLTRVDWPLTIDAVLTVVAMESEAAELADPFDSVMLEDGELRLLVAAEDDILAGLPLAPMHPENAGCRPDGGAEPRIPGTANRPFAELGAMLDRRGRDD